MKEATKKSEILPDKANGVGALVLGEDVQKALDEMKL